MLQSEYLQKILKHLLAQDTLSHSHNGAGKNQGKDGNIMREKAFQIENKYKELYFNLEDRPPVGEKVVYMPSYDAMIYLLYGDYYKQYLCEPGDIFTVKKVSEKNHTTHNLVYVKENKYFFSPAELIPADFVDEKDIKTIKEIYQQKLVEKIEKEKK